MLSNDFSKIKIAISGKSGCGNTTVSKMLAEKLGVKNINWTFRNMAEEKNIEFYEFCKMAEQDSSFDLELDKKQIELAKSGGCVLGSRLAIWLLKDADLKVYLYASAVVRAGRIGLREGDDLEKIIKLTDKRDKQDSKRYQNLYGIDNSVYDFADLIIDTEKYLPNEIVEIIFREILKRKKSDKK